MISWVYVPLLRPNSNPLNSLNPDFQLDLHQIPHTNKYNKTWLIYFVKIQDFYEKSTKMSDLTNVKESE